MKADELVMFALGRTPFDDRERDSLKRFVADIPLLEQAFDEHADPAHITGSAIVVGARGVILHRHKRLGIWLQMGGHVETGETVEQAALREACEETGLAVRHPASGPQLVHVDVHPGPKGHTHYDVRYLTVAPALDPCPGIDESPDVRWFGWDEAIDLADAGLRGGLCAVRPLCEFEIRRAQKGDSAAVAEVYLRSRRWALPTVGLAHSDDEVGEWIAGTLIPGDGVGVGDGVGGGVWVAVNGAGAVVAMMALSEGWLDHLYLDPSVVGMGLGERLVDWAVDRMPGGVQLWTFQCNAAARRFYARCGFREVEFTDGAANEEREPDVRLVREM
jgi:8-oxo-dGTP pyrophosphatase MutT (NUDIX family)/ribosomal protein S18 acetylase RimI-like enzyme